MSDVGTSKKADALNTKKRKRAASPSPSHTQSQPGEPGAQWARLFGKFVPPETEADARFYIQDGLALTAWVEQDLHRRLQAVECLFPGLAETVRCCGRQGRAIRKKGVGRREDKVTW